MNDIERPNWNGQTKALVVVVLLVIFGFLLYKFGAVLAPLVVAVILAYVLSPLVNNLQHNLKLPRVAAILLVYMLVALVITATLWLIIPMLARQVGGITLDIEHLLAQARSLAAEKVNIFGYELHVRDVISQVSTSLQGMIEPAFGRTLNLLGGVVETVVWAVFVVVISIYLIKDAAGISAWVQHLVPPGYQTDYAIIKQEINTIWNSFFRGQLLLALIVAMIITAEGFLIGLRFALLMGVLAGLLEFFPSIGHGIWLTIALLVGLIGGSTWLPIPHWAFALVIVAFHILFTQFDLNYLIPRIIGRSVHLPPLVVLLGILSGAALAGVMGVVLAAPSIASLRVLGRYIYARLFDLEPFPGVTYTSPLPPPDLRWWSRRIVQNKNAFKQE